jgi:hypothetical protein
MYQTKFLLGFANSSIVVLTCVQNSEVSNESTKASSNNLPVEQTIFKSASYLLFPINKSTVENIKELSFVTNWFVFAIDTPLHSEGICGKFQVAHFISGSRI